MGDSVMVGVAVSSFMRRAAAAEYFFERFWAIGMQILSKCLMDVSFDVGNTGIMSRLVGGEFLSTFYLVEASALSDGRRRELLQLSDIHSTINLF